MTRRPTALLTLCALSLLAIAGGCDNARKPRSSDGPITSGPSTPHAEAVPIWVSSSSAQAGAPVTITVQLSQPAPQGGVKVVVTPLCSGLNSGQTLGAYFAEGDLDVPVAAGASTGSRTVQTRGLAAGDPAFVTIYLVGRDAAGRGSGLGTVVMTR